MRLLTPLQVFSAAAAIALLAACSGGSSIAPNLGLPKGGAHSAVGRVPVALNAFGFLKVNASTAHHFTSFYACPAKGPIKYVADNNNSVIYIYAGRFNGQAPCGQIASLAEPQGIYVRPDTHDLYVANFNFTIEVFHRGQTTPYNSYTDPSNQAPEDVTVAHDGTVIVSNFFQFGPELGSISTWVGGPNGGTFVGNFPMTNNGYGEFITEQKNGTLYFDNYDSQSGRGTLWFVSCPGGACGPQTQVAGVSFNYPGGMVFDDSGDLLVSDSGSGTVDRFELPNPDPKSIPVGGFPLGLAINVANHHVFVADGNNHDAAEYLYPGGRLLGAVPCCTEGPVGVAVDP